MRAANTSEVIIEAFLFHEYSGAAADEAFGGGLLGFIQTTGDFIAAPELVAERAAVGTVKTIDAILSDETSALEYLERVGQSAEDFANADIRDQATSVGTGVGNAALLAAEVVSGTRVARLGGRTPDGDAPDGPDADSGDAPYDPQAVQAELEARYGADNVTSTTLPPSDSRFPALAGTSETLSNGERIVFDIRGFPIFDDIARYETRVDLSPDNRRADLRAATRDLRTAINDGRVDPGKFEPDQLAAIRGGWEKIPGLTWHHHQDRGRMQLVPEDAHSEVGHIGGASLLGGGSHES